MRTVHCVALLALLGGCTATIPDGRYACATSAECPDGFTCQISGGSGFCFRSAVDAGEADLHFDAGPPVDGAPPRDDAGGDAGACTCAPDGDPCTSDACSGDGACDYPPESDGTPCGTHATCAAGECRCTDPWAICGSTECSVNTNDSDAHCGGCGRQCVGATPSCVGGTCLACTADADCADMSDCTLDTCGGIACVHTIAMGRCFISGECVAANAPNPANPCQVCNPAGSTTGWSARGDGLGCDDGNFCNGADTCLGGDCRHPGPPCTSGCAGSACCGETAEACCPGGVCSGSGRACEGDTAGICRPCGSTGQICCGTGSWSTRVCAAGHICTDNGTVAGVCS